ncbi:MAG: sigma-70 family RNA polymerase sigma factor [Bacillota bacterium]|nr:sigma-70 family RNA polymerase sigma factor [Bacillota bacterium]
MNEVLQLKQAQNGNKEAFKSLISFYYPFISKYLLNLTGSPQLCEDLTQETLIRIIRSIDEFDIGGPASFSTYTISIAKHLYFDYLRKNKQLTSLDEEIPSKANIADDILNKMQIEEIIHLIETLPEQQAIPIRLKYFEQLTLKEIAEKLSCEPNTIKSRIHNGIVKLRKRLKGGD